MDVVSETSERAAQFMGVECDNEADGCNSE